jgi:hypothetical protein
MQLAPHALQRASTVVASILVMFLLAVSLVPRASAAASLVQTTSSTATGGNVSVSITSATAGNLLVIVCGMNSAATISTPSGYSVAINESGDPAQAIFYKSAAGGETSAGCTYNTTNTGVIHFFEYSGMHAYTALDAVSAGGSTGNSGTAATGNVTTTHASDVLIAAVTSDSSGGTPNTWTNSFTSQNSGTVGGKPSNRMGYGSADRIVTSTGTYSSTVGVGSAAWRGQIVAFKTLADSPALTFDIVNGSGVSVGSPSAALGSTSPTFICQTVTGNLGSSTERLRVTNTTDNPSWTLSMAATGGPTATWSYSGPPARSYAFNNSAGSGCTSGQLTVNASAGTLSAQAGCSTTGVTKGSSTAFVSGSVNTVTILNAASPANIDCYWELINVGLSQKVPPGQLGGNYTINMTLTITAN